MQISKSSASNALKNLELRGVLEYVTYPGDRKRYFRFVSANISDMIDEVEKKMQQKLDIMNQIIELKKNPNSRNTKFIKNIMEGIQFFVERIDKLKEEYESNTKRKEVVN